MFVALAFNEKINQRDLEGLSALMTEDHTFTDNSGEITVGKEEMTKGWRNFFNSFPDYQNIFTNISVKDNIVVIIGHSACSNEPKLNGPSIWTAKIKDSKVAAWRVYWIDSKR
jgi:ketosteroid isomerase-like protein